MKSEKCSECGKKATYVWWRSQFTSNGSLEPVGFFCSACAEEDFPDGVVLPFGEDPNDGEDDEREEHGCGHIECTGMDCTE